MIQLQCSHWMGTKRQGEGNSEGAFEYFTKAAKLGEIGAHYSLSIMYATGKGVEKDMKKELHHLEEAAIGGHPEARYNLGCVEQVRGSYDRAAKHFTIAANLGLDEALNALKQGFVRGIVGLFWRE